MAPQVDKASDSTTGADQNILLAVYIVVPLVIVIVIVIIILYKRSSDKQIAKQTNQPSSQKLVAGTANFQQNGFQQAGLGQEAPRRTSGNTTVAMNDTTLATVQQGILLRKSCS
jgi:hypothetical protein